MSALLRDRLTIVWAGLVLATLVSVLMGADHGSLIGVGPGMGVAVVLVIAMIKAHFVGAEFMELRSAPPVLRIAFDVWCVGVAAVLVVLFVK